MTATEPSDAVLLRELLAGDEGAFVELYRRRRGDVYRFAYALSRSAAVAQDVAQDVFVGLLENAARFDPAKGSVRAWLLGTARHLVLDRLRAAGRRAALPLRSEEEAAPCRGVDEIHTAQRLARLHAAIVELPFEYRETLALVELAELSYAECAALLGCPIGTVRSRLHRARALLAARLDAGREMAAARPVRASEVC